MTATAGAKRIAQLTPLRLKAAKALRKQYSDRQILAELTQCARRLGTSPTMREFEADEQVQAHPKTVIARFGSWNEAKRLAGLRAVRFASDEELLAELTKLGAQIGHAPSSHEVKAATSPPSPSLYINRFGSLARALQLAGFDVAASADEKLDRAIREGVELLAETGSVPSMTAWAALRTGGAQLTGEFAIYRLCRNDVGLSGWAAFTALVHQEAGLLAQADALAA